MKDRQTKIGIIPLSEAKEGSKARLFKLNGGQKFVNRLYSMGFTPQVIIEVINNRDPGPLILKIENSRIMLGRGMASKIEVEELNN